MARSTEPRHFPRSDDPVARFEAVVKRGRSLHRRQQVVTGTGAGGAVAASALAVGFLTGGRGTQNVSTNSVESAAVVTLPKSSAATPTITDAGGVTTTADLDGRTLNITVRDPHQPVLPGAQACVTVDLTAPSGAGPVAEGVGCDARSTDGGTSEFALQPTNGASVGCASVAERLVRPDAPVSSEGSSAPQILVNESEPAGPDITIEDPSILNPDTPTSSTPGHTSATREVTHQFTSTIPSTLPPGRYQLRISSTSGVGDGCAGEIEGSTEIERSSDVVIDILVN